MVRPAKISEISKIAALAHACAAKMISLGILQWNDHYPSRKVFENDIKRGELWVMEKNGDPIGTVVLGTAMDDEYKDVTWLTLHDKNLYIHRLAVHPDFQGKGYAQRLMDFAEDFARRNRFDSIRLDTFSQNKRNQRFYETRGYQKLGDIYYPKQSEHPFHCYEMVL